VGGASWDRRPADFVIGDDYLRRWWLIPRNPILNVYAHHFTRSDDDRALHDHPWWSISIVLSGVYFDHAPGGAVRVVWPGDIVIRSARTAHRVELMRGPENVERPAHTLFITGPRIREWGFWCPNGWRHWRDFTSGSQGERVGRGCD
jgi:hypothetical protein